MSTVLRGSRLIDICTPSISYDAQVQAASQAFDYQMYEIIDDTGQVVMIPNIMGLTDETLIDILAWQFHVDFYDKSKPFEFRKQLVQLAIIWHKTKGTVALVNEVINTYWSGGGYIQEWFEYRIPFPPQIGEFTLGGTFGPSSVNPIDNMFNIAGFANVRFVQFKQGATSTLPAPIVDGQIYSVVNADASVFQIAETPTGTPIDLTSSGTGNTNEYWTPNTAWHDRYRFRVVVDDAIIPNEQIPQLMALIAKYKPISRWPEGETIAPIKSLGEVFVCGYMLETIVMPSAAPKIRPPPT